MIKRFNGISGVNRFADLLGIFEEWANIDPV